MDLMGRIKFQWSKYLLFFYTVLLFSCEKKDECTVSDEIKNVPIELEIVRLEKEMAGLKSKDDIKTFLDKHNDFSEAFLRRSQYPYDSILVDEIHKLVRDPYIDTLYQETERIFTDLEPLKQNFVRAFKHFKYYYPEFKIPKIKTVITGFGQDLLVTDSLIVIGLDFFLGPEAKYRPVQLPLYIMRRFSQEYIVPTSILNLSKLYNQTNYKDKTVLAEMIFFGKSYYFTKKILPCTPDSLIIQYTAQELKDVNENEDVIWANFVQNQLLYETSHFVKKKYLEERPYIPEIGKKCPGRIGAWLGWEIVKAYQEENEKLPLQELMKIDDAQLIFTQSNYKPQSG